MGIFGISAQPQEEVDKAVKEWGVGYPVSMRGRYHVLANGLIK